MGTLLFHAKRCFMSPLFLFTSVKTVARRRGKTRTEKKTASRVCPLRLAMGTLLVHAKRCFMSPLFVCTFCERYAIVAISSVWMIRGYPKMTSVRGWGVGGGSGLLISDADVIFGQPLASKNTKHVKAVKRSSCTWRKRKTAHTFDKSCN